MGFRVGIIAQPDWNNPDDFMKLGKPNLYFGITAGNMDSLINKYTADLKVRSDDAYTPHGEKEGKSKENAEQKKVRTKSKAKQLKGDPSGKKNNLEVQKNKENK